MISPLQLSHFFTEEVLVEENPTFSPSAAKRKEGKIHCEVDVGRATTAPTQFQVKFLVTVDPAQEAPALDPYRVRVRVTGQFVFTDDVSQGDMVRMVQLNGSSILFGLVRGIVAQVTGTGRFGGYLLPTVNFIEMFKGQNQKKSQPPREEPPPTRLSKRRPPSRSKRKQAIRN